MAEIQTSQHKKWVYPFLGVALIALSIYLIALTRNTWKINDYIGKSTESPHTITISGKGKAYAIPDIAQVSLGLKTEKSSVTEAQVENTKKINALHAELLKLDIPKKDITTTQYNVYPVYDWANNRQNLRAYSVDQNISLKIRDFDKIPKVLKLIGELGLNQVGGLSFDVENIDIFEQEARTNALKNAKEKAKALAKEAEVKLGRVISFSENNSVPPPYMPYYKSYAMEAGMLSDVPAPTVQPGNQEITVQVTISYEIL